MQKTPCLKVLPYLLVIFIALEMLIPSGFAYSDPHLFVDSWTTFTPAGAAGTYFRYSQYKKGDGSNFSNTFDFNTTWVLTNNTKVGSPDGNVYLRIWNATNIGTGIIVNASRLLNTSTNYFAPGDFSTSFATYNFSISVNMNAGNTYIIELWADTETYSSTNYYKNAGGTSTGTAGFVCYQDYYTPTSVEGYATPCRTQYAIYGINESAAPPSIDYFTITLTDSFDSSSILNFTAIVNGTTYSTTNGTINTDLFNNMSATVQINLSSNFNGGYFPKTYSYDISTDLAGNLSQAIITFQGLELISNSAVNNYSFVMNGTKRNTTNGTFNMNLKAGTYFLTYINTTGTYSPDYTQNQSQTFIVYALDNKTVNLSFFSSRFTLLVKEISTNISVAGYNMTIESQNYTWSNSYTNQTNQTSNLSLIPGTYEFTINVEGYAQSIQNLTITNGTTNQTIFLYSANSIWIYAFDEDSGGTVYNFSTRLYNLNASYENDTATGIAQFNNVGAGYYTVRVSSGGYGNRYYNATMTGGSHLDLTVYLSMVAGNTTFIFKDKYTSETIEGVSLAMYRLLNSSWIVVSSVLSDITGRVFISYSADTQYKFICSIANYSSKEFLLTPVYDSYDVILNPIYSGENPVQLGFTTAYISGNVSNNQNNFLTLYISNPYCVLTEYGFNISWGGNSYSTTGSNCVGGTLARNMTVSTSNILDYLTVIYWFNESSGVRNEFTVKYPIGNISSSNMTFLSTNKNNKYGLGDFELLLISSIIILVLAGFGAVVGGGIGAGTIGLLTTGFFVYMGFIPLWAFLPFAIIVIIILIAMARGGYQ